MNKSLSLRYCMRVEESFRTEKNNAGMASNKLIKNGNCS